MTTIAKMENGRIVEICRVANVVQFSDQRGWILVCYDFEKPRHLQANVKWIPVTTRFTWVREYNFS